MEKTMGPHSSTPSWKIPWTEEPGSLVRCSPWGHWGSDRTEQLHFHALEKEMATHSSVLACTPCTILCSTHICMTLRDITFGHLSILPYPLKWKLHTGRASDMFTLWHVLQVLKKRAVEWRCGAHLQAFMDRVFPAAWLPPDPSLVRSCSSSITHQRGTLWHHCHGSSSRICAPDTVHVPTVRTHGTRTVRSWGSSPGVSYNLGHWSLRVRHEAAGTVNLCSAGPHIRNTPSNPSLVSWRDHLDVPLL